MTQRLRPGIFVTALALASFAFAAEHSVSSAEEVHTALKAAKPGDVLILTDGEWKDQLITFAAEGTKDQPITLRAQTPGQVKLVGNSGVNFTGEHCVASGLFFGESESTDPAVAFNGSDNRVTDSAIVSMNRGGKWVHFQSGQRNRLDHCYLEGHAREDVTLQVEVDEKVLNEAWIHHNHFGPRPPLGKNGGETIRVGYSHQQTRISGTIVESNLFDRCDGEIEIISNKSTGNVYRYNTFRNCEGTLTLRHGHRAVVDANYFLGGPAGRSGGIRVIGAGHIIINNYFENCAPTAGGVIALTCAIREPKPTEYQHVDRAFVESNTIVNCGLPYIRLDAGFAPERTRDVLPVGVVVANNILFAGGKTDASSEAAGLIHGREGRDFRCVGNVAFGADVGGERKEGFTVVDPKLSKAADGIFRPAADSPVRGAAKKTIVHVDFDLDGQPRPPLPNDVGADEVSDAPAKNKPLQPGDVGPSWRKSEKTASAEAMQVRRATYAAQSAPTPQPAPLPVDPRGGRDPIYFTAHPDLFLRYERESRSFVMKGPRGWGATSVTLCPQIVGQRTVWAVDVEHEDERGKARAFEVQSDAGEQRFWTYDDHPMLFTRVTVRNATSAPIELKQLVPLVVRLKTAPPTLRAQQLRLFGADGPTTAEEGKTAEGALAVVEREGSFGLVAGWVAPKQVRSATVSATYDGKITVEGRSEYENVKIAPGEALTSETFAIGFAEDAPEGLKRLAAR